MVNVTKSLSNEPSIGVNQSSSRQQETGKLRILKMANEMRAENLEKTKTTVKRLKNMNKMALKKAKQDMTCLEQQMEEIATENNKDFLRQFMQKRKMDRKEMETLMKQIEKEDKKEKEDINNEMETEEISELPSTSKSDPKPEAAWREAQRPKGPKKTTKDTNDKNNKKENVAEKAPQKKKEPKPPTITTYRVDPKVFNTVLGDTKVTYRVKEAQKISISTTTAEDHGKVMSLLKEQRTGGHSYTPLALRKTILVMKDIHSSVSEEEIKASLKEQTGLEVGVKRMSSPRSRNLNYPLNMVMVTTTAENAPILRKVFSIDNLIIRWENLMKKGLTQCHNCQQFGHIAEYCMNEYRCVKCDKPHGPKECKRNRDDKEGPYCWNCQETGHPASWGGCPKAIELREKVEEKRMKKQMIIENAQKRREYIASNAMITPGCSYADSAKKNTQYESPKEQVYIQPNAAEGNIGFLGTECQRLFNTNMFKLLDMAREFVPKYRQLRSDQEQRDAMLNFLSQL